MGFNRGSEGKSRRFSFSGGSNKDLTCPGTPPSSGEGHDAAARWAARWEISPDKQTAKKQLLGFIIEAEDSDDGGRITKITNPLSSAGFRRCVIGKKSPFVCRASFLTNCSEEEIGRLTDQESQFIFFPEEGKNWWE